MKRSQKWGTSSKPRSIEISNTIKKSNQKRKRRKLRRKWHKHFRSNEKNSWVASLSWLLIVNYFVNTTNSWTMVKKTGMKLSKLSNNFVKNIFFWPNLWKKFMLCVFNSKKLWRKMCSPKVCWRTIVKSLRISYQCQPKIRRLFCNRLSSLAW